MKTIKKVAALVMALTMILAMSAVAFAAPTNDGKITVTNAVVDQEYSIYQIFKLDSYNDAGNYLYTVNEEWVDFVEDQDYFVTIDTDGYVVANPANATAENAKKFAAAAIAYAKAHNIDATATKTATSADPEAVFTTVEFTGLELGYYLLDSSLGTLCSLDTTDKEIEVTEKNDIPELEKEVKEDDNGEWVKANTAGLGETVDFKITVTAQKGAEYYIVRDDLSAGLTLLPNTIEVEGMTAGAQYELITDTTKLDEGDDFQINFSQSYLDTITEETTIVITYSAVVNENAVVYPGANPNEATLKYGNNAESETEPSTTETFMFEFDVVKTDTANEVLEGAKFELYASDAEGAQALKLVEEDPGVYHIATAEELAAETVAKVTEFTAGQVTITGLDIGTYYLKETKAPEGFNALKELIPVVVTQEDAASLKATVENYAGNNQWKSGGVQVINNTGAELPSTGGIGTTIFYVVGALLVAGAVIVLVSRKRMSCEA